MPYLFDAVICFDLDDTLYKEVYFLKSAFSEIAEAVGHPEAFEQMMDWYYAGENAFVKLIDTYQLTMSVADCLQIYRGHIPIITLDEGVKDYLLDLKRCGAKLGLISDGRSITQRNKIKALGLEAVFDIVIISEEFGSEKPCLKNYQAVMAHFPERSRFVYVGDNPAKDFIAPNLLGWKTVGILDNGINIHKQRWINKDGYCPSVTINSINELLRYL